MTGQAASRTIVSISPSACSELAPSPTSATSGRSRAVIGGDVFDLDLARDDLVAECNDDRDDELEAVFTLVGDQDAEIFGSVELWCHELQL